ncbi:hypothetical protein [Asticcacaulis sp.]|uniref:hypothetical protein n=1 Tax=Asticcacaulis sp. TaxID=1872648 RepID=UPI002C11318A|nr:hypothetical protein [Asticcacaulis sp.]HTM79635.1 hypothetical protein [Asticcacaulis sp.]
MYTICLSLRSLAVMPLIVASLSAPAFAQETPVAPPPTATRETPVSVPMSLEELGEVSAEGAVTNVVTTQDLTATNSGNTITAGTVQNGDINFSGNALTGFSGVGNFVTNTGNNNNLQGSISVTITGAPLSQ